MINVYMVECTCDSHNREVYIIGRARNAHTQFKLKNMSDSSDTPTYALAKLSSF